MAKVQEFKSKSELIRAYADAFNTTLAYASGLVTEYTRMGFIWYKISDPENFPFLWGRAPKH